MPPTQPSAPLLGDGGSASYSSAALRMQGTAAGATTRAPLLTPSTSRPPAADRGTANATPPAFSPSVNNSPPAASAAAAAAAAAASPGELQGSVGVFGGGTAASTTRDAAAAATAAGLTGAEITALVTEVVQQLMPVPTPAPLASPQPSPSSAGGVASGGTQIAPEADLNRLSRRIEALQATGLLTQDESLEVFDTISDYLDVTARMAPTPLTLVRACDSTLGGLSASSASGAIVTMG